MKITVLGRLNIFWFSNTGSYRNGLRICFLSFVFFLSLWTNKLLAQASADSSAKKDTIVHASPISQAPTPSSQPHSVVSLEFVKEKVEHSPDSTYFNILKITNNNGNPIQGTVRISVPQGWKLISDEETAVNVSPGNTQYIPIRVSLARTALGGVSYLINATLHSNRSLFPDKNQTSVSKACYIIVPQKRQWDFYAIQRTIYFDRYSPYSPLKLKLVNKGNGTEVVKLEFEIGSSLEMYGSLGNIHYTSVALRPLCDTIISFPIKYIPAADESDLWNRDFRKLTVRITATVDSIIKKTSVNFKYLESTYYNLLMDKVTPLTVELQLQNILSDVSPRMLMAAYGTIFLKNDDVIDYNVRFYNIPFEGYTNMNAGDYFWRNSRMWAGYRSQKWEVKVGDINSYGSGFFGIYGRGIGGKYAINSTNRIGGAFTAAIGVPIYSGNIFHETMLPKSISLKTSLNLIADNYNLLKTYGATVHLNYPFLPGHNISLLLASSLTQHNYTNQSFLDPNGNYVVTNDPGVSRLGFAGQLGYQMHVKKVSAGVNVLLASKDFSQYFSGKLNINGNAQYFINKKYYLLGSSSLYLQDPHMYNRGILFPENKYFSGVHKVEIANRVTNKLTFFTGPELEHYSYTALKINRLTGDSTYTHFKTISPKLSLRCSYKNNTSGFINPYLLAGYTIVTDAEDSTLILPPSFVPRKTFFNAKAGLNVIQGNWGINVFYYLGPYSLVTQSDYYYFGRYSKSLRIMPFFQKYFFNKTLLLSSYDSYYYEVLSNSERIALNARLQFFLGHDWTFFVDNNLYMSSLVSAEGQKVYSRSYYLSVGVKKAFDIPQPRVKYYNLKIICYRDINGNQVMDGNEQGLSDIVISIDKQAQFDSITKLSKRDPGQFSPAEMVTDNFGQVLYYHIPEGEVNISVFPLQNLKDVFILNGQKQSLNIRRDTTYYIPFAQSYRVIGRVILNRDEYSSAGSMPLANIRITATDSVGNNFPALTSADGSYTLYVPKAGEYKVTINNIFSDQFVLEEPQYTVSFNGAKEFMVDFIFSEKKRAMNINPVAPQPLVNASGETHVVPTNPTNPINPVNNLSPVNPPPANTSGVNYRVQIASSPTRLSQAQWAKMFKGVDKVQEYTEAGVYKYTAGDFSTFEFDNATDYKDKLRAMGYKDAFIVFFKDNKRVTTPPSPGNKAGGVKDTSSSAVPVNTAPPATTASPANDAVSYRVQLASSASKLTSAQQAQQFKGVDNIKEYQEGGTYKYTAGNFADHAKAVEYKNKLNAMGFKGVFIVSFKGDQKVK